MREASHEFTLRLISRVKLGIYSTSRFMHPLELSKENVMKFWMEFVPIRFEQTLWDDW